MLYDATGVIMNVICAWCKGVIGYNKDIEKGLVSHGICPKCSQTFKNNMLTKSNLK